MKLPQILMNFIELYMMLMNFPVNIRMIIILVRHDGNYMSKSDKAPKSEMLFSWILHMYFLVDLYPTCLGVQIGPILSQSPAGLSKMASNINFFKKVLQSLWNKSRSTTNLKTYLH